MHPPPFTDGSTDALIASRLPSWLTGASLNTLYSLHASQQWQQHVQHQLHEWLASILPLDAFAAPLLQQALYTRHGLTLDVRKAMLRRRTLQRFPITHCDPSRWGERACPSAEPAGCCAA